MLVVHHWDADGIVSAAKIVRIEAPGEFENISPDIGVFSFPDRIRKAVDRHDRIYVLDLNLPEEVGSLGRELTFMDHHIQARIESAGVTHINPLLDGAVQADYPSCTTVVSDHYGSWDVLSALGAVGDVGRKALDHPGVKKELDDAGFSFEEAQRIVDLIDSNYLKMDQGAVEEAVRTVLTSEPRDLLEIKAWNRNLEDIGRALDDALAGREDRGGLAYMEFTSPFNIVSKVARRAVWDLGYDAAVAVNRGFHGHAQTYIRIGSGMEDLIDMDSIIRTLKELGISAGGKSVVMGSIYPGERVEEVLEVVGSHLERLSEMISSSKRRNFENVQ